MDGMQQRDWHEEDANRRLMEEEQHEYDADLFADTWDAEPFDPAELNVTLSDDELPEWMIGSY